MRVVCSKVLGFCMGVRRAVTMAAAEAARLESSGGRAFTLGPLIHNSGVLAELKNKGVQIIDKLPSDLQGSTIIIRAHGISPALERVLRDRGCYIVDATCPNVKASQLKAEEFAREGYCIFLAGQAKHAEIEGILGYAQAASAPFCKVVANPLEARLAAGKLYRSYKDAKTVLLGQTTIIEKDYLSIGESLRMFFPNIEIIETICAATAERQQALRELLDQVDAVVVAGGRESANTLRLFAIAKESGKPCVLAENADDIPPDFFAFEVVGICAGASTPDSVIDEIEAKLLG